MVAVTAPSAPSTHELGSHHHALCMTMQKSFLRSTNTARGVLHGNTACCPYTGTPCPELLSKPMLWVLLQFLQHRHKTTTPVGTHSSQRSHLQVSQPSCVSAPAGRQTHVLCRGPSLGMVVLNYSHGISSVTEQLTGCGVRPSSSRVRLGLAHLSPGCQEVPAAFWTGSAAHDHSSSSPCCACLINLLIFSVQGMHSQK